MSGGDRACLHTSDCAVGACVVASVPVRARFRPVAQRRRRQRAGARLPRVGLADAERVVVPRRRPPAHARHRLARLADGVGARPAARVAPDDRRRRGDGPRLLHVRRVVGRLAEPAQRHRPRQSQRSAACASLSLFLSPWLPTNRGPPTKLFIFYFSLMIDAYVGWS